MEHRTWTAEDIGILREKYPIQGTNIQELLSKRSRESIKSKAYLLGTKLKRSDKVVVLCRECGRKSTTTVGTPKLFCNERCHHKAFRGIHTSPSTEFIKLKRPWSEEELTKLFLEDELSPYELAKRFGSSRSTVRRSLIELGLEMRPHVAALHQSRHKRKVVLPTKPERKLIQIIEDFNLLYRYVGDSSFCIGPMNPDFISLNGTKKVIEVFGDYWHREGCKWKASEFGRKARMSQFGYDCLVIWESELHSQSDEEIANRIKDFDESQSEIKLA